MKNDNWYKELRQETSEHKGFWTRGTKIKIGITFIVVGILLGTYLGSAVTRHISGTGDTVETFIRCSNGNYYAATTAANLQLALDQKGLITLPECNISVTTTLQMYGGTILQGRGNKTILYLAAGSNNHNIINISGKNHFIEKIKFDSNNGSQTGTLSCGIWLNMLSGNTTIRDCMFIRSFWYGINQVSSATPGNLTVENCYFFKHKLAGYGGAICFRGTNGIAKNNHIENMYATGIVMEGGSFTQKFIIDGNTIIGPISVGIYMEASGNSQYAIITNNILVNINYTAYAGSPDGIAILATDNCTVSNNLIIYAARGGIKVAGSNSNVNSNIISETGRGYIGGYGINVGNNNIVSDNIISIKVVGLVYSQPDYGIVCGINNTVNGNSIKSYGSGRFAYGINSGVSSIINDNTITFCMTGIRANGQYTMIKGNMFSNCGLSSNPAIQLTSSNFSIVSHNIILGASRGIRVYRSCNCTIDYNSISASSATYAIYEATSPCDFNSISFNNVLLSGTPATSIVILKASGNSSSLFNYGCYKTMWTHLMANPIAGAQWVNITTGKIGTYTGSAWTWH